MPIEVTYLQASDWCALYIGGTLKYEGHSVDTDYLLTLLKGHTLVSVSIGWYRPQGEDWLIAGGRFGSPLVALLKEHGEDFVWEE